VGLTKEQKFQFLENYGIDVVVSLVDFDTDMQDMYRYIQSMQPDSKHISFTEIERIALEVNMLIDAGHVALVHCNGGRNRSGLVNALIVMLQLHCSGKEALEYVRKKRPNAIATAAFENYLLSKS